MRWCDITAAVKLTGGRVFLFSEHRNAKRDHGEIEEIVASSPRCLIRPGNAQGASAAVESEGGFGEFSNALSQAAGARFCGLDANGDCGVGRELYSAQNGKKSREFQDLEDYTLGRLLPPSSTRLRRGRRKALRAGPRASAIGREKGAGELPNWAAAVGPRWGKVSRPKRGWAEGVRGGKFGWSFFPFFSVFFFQDNFQKEF